jgi:hypothetical protein
MLAVLMISNRGVITQGEAKITNVELQPRWVHSLLSLPERMKARSQARSPSHSRRRTGIPT